MAKTKDKILYSSLRLFNEKGFVNVRLQHIADDCNISVGNLAYHFYSKEAIIFALIKGLMDEHKRVLANYTAVPLFNHIDNIIEQNFALQQKYKFFYLDTLEVHRLFSKVKTLSQKNIHQQLIQIEGMFVFNAARGAFIKNQDYKCLARTFWMMGHLWMYEQNLIGNVDYLLPEYKNQLWQLLFPYCTDLGVQEYKRLNYYKK